MITSVRELSGGRTLVADRGEEHLYLVDWETGNLEEVLRRGDGPGEYRLLGWLYGIGDHETLLTDDARFRWILLRGAEAVRTFNGADRLNQRFRGRLDGVAASGEVLASVSAERPGSGPADLRILERARGLGPFDGLPRLDTIGFIKGGGVHQIACVLATRGPPACHYLEAEDQALLFPDGWIAAALQKPYHIEWRSPDGDWIRGEALPNTPVPLDEAERCAAINQWVEGDTGTGCDEAEFERYLWQDTLPPFLTDSRLCPACWGLAAGEAPWLFADPRGRLVVRRTPRRSRRENVYDVIDRTGRLVERVKLPLNEAIVGFGESTVYTIRVDEVDLQWLRRHPWRD